LILDAEELATYYVQKGGENSTYHNISGTHTKLHGVVTQTNRVWYSIATKTPHTITSLVLTQSYMVWWSRRTQYDILPTPKLHIP